MGVLLLEVAQRRQLAVFHLLQHLEHPGDAGCALGMAEIGFDRPDMAKATVAGIACKGPLERVDLDRVAEPGAGAVGLDIAQAARIDARILPGVHDHVFLAGHARCGQRRRVAAVQGSRTLDHTVDRVAIGQRLRQRLEQQRRHAFARHIAVGARIEGVAAPRWRQRPDCREIPVVPGRQQQIAAADKGHLALAVAQRNAGGMQRHQRRRARRVEHQARPFEVEPERNPVGRDGPAAGGDVRVHRQTELGDLVEILVEAGADEHAGATAAQPLDHPGVLGAGVGALEQQPYLGIHPLGFAAGHVEEVGVEPIDAVDEAAPLGVSPIMRLGIGVEPGRHVPVVRRHLLDQLAALPDIAPELVEIAGFAEPALHADDRDVPIAAGACESAVRTAGRKPGHDGACGGRRGVGRCTPLGQQRRKRRPVRLPQKGCQFRDTRILEEHGRFQLDRRGACDPSGQADQLHGLQPQVHQVAAALLFADVVCSEGVQLRQQVALDPFAAGEGFTLARAFAALQLAAPHPLQRAAVELRHQHAIVAVQRGVEQHQLAGIFHELCVDPARWRYLAAMEDQRLDAEGNEVAVERRLGQQRDHGQEGAVDQQRMQAVAAGVRRIERGQGDPGQRFAAVLPPVERLQGPEAVADVDLPADPVDRGQRLHGRHAGPEPGRIHLQLPGGNRRQLAAGHRAPRRRCGMAAHRLESRSLLMGSPDRHLHPLAFGQRDRGGKRQPFQLQRLAVGELAQAGFQRQAGIGQPQQNPPVVELVVPEIGFVMLVHSGRNRVLGRRRRLDRPLRVLAAMAGPDRFEFPGRGFDADLFVLDFSVQHPNWTLHGSLPSLAPIRQVSSEYPVPSGPVSDRSDRGTPCWTAAGTADRPAAAACPPSAA